MDGIASSVPLIARPSFDRACSFAPSEYVQAWEWFLREEQRGGLWDKLSHRTNAGSVEKVGVAPDPKRVGPASWNLEYG